MRRRVGRRRVVTGVRRLTGLTKTRGQSRCGSGPSGGHATLLAGELSFSSSESFSLWPAWPQLHRPVRTCRTSFQVQQLDPLLASASAGTESILVQGRTRPGAQCGAVVSVKTVRQQLTQLKADRRGHVGWRWVILSTSPSGTWQIKLSCRLGRRTGAAVRRVLIITGSSSSAGSIGDPNTLTTTAGATAGNGAGVCGPFPPGQCTCLAYQKRPDVYSTAVN